MADVWVPAESPWFDGHFPGRPVLPGIAQLGMVADLVQAALGFPARVLEVSRVRFKQLIVPGDRLQVSAEPRPGRDGAYAFRLTRQETVVCSGTMIVESVEPEQRDGSREPTRAIRGTSGDPGAGFPAEPH